jgi:hypothetical protein
MLTAIARFPKWLLHTMNPNHPLRNRENPQLSVPESVWFGWQIRQERGFPK